MEKRELDLTIKKYADQSINKSAIIGMYIMNGILVLAYLLEVVKGMRTPISYTIFAVLCIAPVVAATILYRKKQDAFAIRYILGIGFSVMYGYVMFSSPTDIAFCYYLVVLVLLMVYVDARLLSVLAALALAINVVRFILKSVTGGLQAIDITNFEIVVACLILTSLFVMVSTKKISAINQANINKAEREKEQSFSILNTTMEVATAISKDIANVAVETEQLKNAIGETSQSMDALSSGANEVSLATEEQAASTARISKYIQKVDVSTQEILNDSEDAQEKLETGRNIMQELLEQVKKSEASGILVTEKVTGLKEYAVRMQEIMGLISNVSKQTGLLALNASIEAARAGEAGRGFGVVASEISNLADQTDSATKDITELIENIVTSIEEAANAMSLLLESSQSQNEYISVTADNFEKIHHSTKGIIGQVSQLKRAVDVVTKENGQIEEKITYVTSITQEVTARSEDTLEACSLNLASVEEVTAIMENLKIEAEKLLQEGN